MKSLTDKVVLITGASSGIGRATASTFAGAGARVLLCARRLELLFELETSLLKAGAAGVLLFRLDVRNRDAVDSAIANLPPDWTAVDVLVNNAGLSRGMTRLHEDDPDDWDDMIDTNVKGLLYVTRAVLPGMVQRRAGHIINLGALPDCVTCVNGVVYRATKAAERAISEGLKADLLGTPLRVTSVDPGIVQTDFSRVRFRGDEDRAAKAYENIMPLQPEDVADAILWAATRPDHVNIHSIVLTTADQANSTVVRRRGDLLQMDRPA